MIVKETEKITAHSTNERSKLNVYAALNGQQQDKWR